MDMHMLAAAANRLRGCNDDIKCFQMRLMYKIEAS